MNRELLSMAALVTILAGCSHPASSPAAKSLELTSARPSSFAPEAAPHANARAADNAPTRVAGDYVVYRFSGAFHKGPVTLTERVLEASGPLLLVELTLKGGKNDGTLRVRFDTTPNAKSDVLSVVRVDLAGEKPSTVAAYEALMSETVFAADQNEEVLGTETMKIAIGSKTFDCVQTRYSVIVGRKKGVLSTIASRAFAWGDVGGELKTNDGNLVYRIDIVDAGHERKTSEAVAGNP